jgi:energy-coupling factor transport system ATP-binding protein
MEEVARLVKRLVVMHEGTISLDGPPREIFRHRAALQAAGVDVPGVTALMEKLAARGLAVDAAALTVEEAAASIAAAVRGRGAC